MRTLSCLRKREIDATQDFDPHLLKEPKMNNIDDIIKTINECFDLGAGTVICREEEKKGYKVLDLNSLTWLDASEWNDSILSQDGNKIRIIVIMAKNPHTGAFSRMIHGICAAGLKPVVVTPLPEMEAILRRWGWRGVITKGSYAEKEAQWTPPFKFIKERSI